MTSRLVWLGLAWALVTACGERSKANAPGTCDAPRIGNRPLNQVGENSAALVRVVAPGIVRREIAGDDQHSRLWVYEPQTKSDSKLPLVLIAPAGSNLLTGMRLGEGDMPEHLPWAQSGFLVVAYELSGALDSDDDDALVTAMEAFKFQRAGVDDGVAALNWATASLPVDQTTIVAVGHSSAATHALLFASNSERITHVVAFAPALDIAAFHGAEFEAAISADPAYERFVHWASPGQHPLQIGHPAYLFVAEDDSNTSPASIRDFAAALAQSNKLGTITLVPSGGHYEAMISPGIPGAIEWVRHCKAGAPQSCGQFEHSP